MGMAVIVVACDVIVRNAAHRMLLALNSCCWSRGARRSYLRSAFTIGGMTSPAWLPKLLRV